MTLEHGRLRCDYARLSPGLEPRCPGYWQGLHGEDVRATAAGHGWHITDMADLCPIHNRKLTPMPSPKHGCTVTVNLEPSVALAMIDRHGCEKVTGEQHGHCFLTDRSHPFAYYGDDRACDACLAWLGLQGPTAIPADWVRTHTQPET